MENETIERAFNVSGPARLNVGNVSGFVDVQPGDDGVVKVTAVKRAGSGDMDQTEVEISQAPDGTVTVETRVRDSMWNWLGRRPCDVDYTVRVPRQCSARVRCVSSGASVRGLAGEFELQSVSGDTALADLSGPFKLKNVSGKVSGQGIAGSARIETVSGDVRLAGCQFPSLDGSTVSGDLRLETALGDGPYHLHSVSGNITLTVPPDSRCTVDGTSISGRLETALPNASNRTANRHWHVDVQGGGPQMNFDSISANLRIVSTGAVSGQVASVAPMPAPAPAPAPMPNPAPQPAPQPAVPPPPPAAPQAPVSRSEILDKIARGELSVEDAIKVLDDGK